MERGQIIWNAKKKKIFKFAYVLMNHVIEKVYVVNASSIT